MITEQDFMAYEKVRLSGVTNMFDILKVKQLTGLTREQVSEIMQTYEDCVKEFSETQETTGDVICPKCSSENVEVIKTVYKCLDCKTEETQPVVEPIIKCQTCGSHYPEKFGGNDCPRCEDKWDDAKEMAYEMGGEEE